MERYYKIIGIFIFAAIALYSNAWAYVIGIAFLAQILNLWKRSNFILILVPLTYTLIASVGEAYVWMSLGFIATYIIRCLNDDKCYNESNLWIFFILMFVGTILYTPYLMVLPLIMVSITIPVINLSLYSNVNRYILSSVVILSVACGMIYSSLGYGEKKTRAYLHKGVWARAEVPYEIDNLRNASCYSYSEFVKLIKADTISQLKNLSKYNELWIITPTIPFSKEEISVLKKWVSRGGNLILVSDHTDLYGHARCANQIAQVFGCHINYSATFDKNDKQVFRNSFLSPFDIKTGTNMKGMVFPLLAAWMWEEDAYYANSNFFGPLAISGDDSYGDKLLLGQISYGLGQVSFLQDSTIFSNFAVYQPYVMDMAKFLSGHSFLARFMFLFPLYVVLVIVCLTCKRERLLSSYSIFVLLCFPLSDTEAFNYGKNPQIWTGNPSLVQENGCTHTTISTIYSLSSLSKRKPLWISDVSTDQNDVIWVDSVCPPNSNWRWIKVKDIHYKRQETNSPWDKLYEYMNAPYIESWDGVTNNFTMLDANPIFNDRIMNDWWYNDGISRNRYARIHAWIGWLNGYNKKVEEIKYNEKLFTKDLHKSILRIEDKKHYELYLPKPIVPNGTEIYLGSGISGYVIQRGDTVSIFGKGQYSENFGGPKIWAVDYIE